MPGEVETLATDEHLAEQAHLCWKVSNHARGALKRRNEGATVAIAVHQLEPGKRIRIPLEYVSSDPPDSFTDVAIPALLPVLVEIAQTNRAAWQSDTAAKAAADARISRRLEAMAKLVGDAS
jgi:hypothetical protein